MFPAASSGRETTGPECAASVTKSRPSVAGTLKQPRPRGIVLPITGKELSESACYGNTDKHGGHGSVLPSSGQICGHGISHVELQPIASGADGAEQKLPCLHRLPDKRGSLAVQRRGLRHGGQQRPPLSIDNAHVGKAIVVHEVQQRPAHERNLLGEGCRIFRQNRSLAVGLVDRFFHASAQRLHILGKHAVQFRRADPLHKLFLRIRPKFDSFPRAGDPCPHFRAAGVQNILPGPFIPSAARHPGCGQHSRHETAGKKQRGTSAPVRRVRHCGHIHLLGRLTGTRRDRSHPSAPHSDTRGLRGSPARVPRPCAADAFRSRFFGFICAQR